MQKRGRKSAEDRAELKIIHGTFAARPEPPAELNARQKEIWRETCASEPDDYFKTGATQTLLKAYCGHAFEVERLTEIMNSFETSWIKNAEGAKRYADLSKMRAKESGAMAFIATKLRLTNQSRYRADKASVAHRNATAGPRPWEE